MRALDSFLASFAVKGFGEAYTDVRREHVTGRTFTVAFVVAEGGRHDAVAFCGRLTWPEHGRDERAWNE